MAVVVAAVVVVAVEEEAAAEAVAAQAELAVALGPEEVQAQAAVLALEQELAAQVQVNCLENRYQANHLESHQVIHLESRQLVDCLERDQGVVGPVVVVPGHWEWAYTAVLELEKHRCGNKKVDHCSSVRQKSLEGLELVLDS